jgi:hypothetical protein
MIRLLPPKSTKYLYAVNDYDNFEFISPVNAWNVQTQYRADFDKLRTVDVTLIPGQMIHIPAYWWYSIKFVKSNTSLCVFKYKTYMNTLSISNHLIMSLLQRQNTKRVIAKKMETREIKENNNVTEGGITGVNIDITEARMIDNVTNEVKNNVNDEVNRAEIHVTDT